MQIDGNFDYIIASYAVAGVLLAGLTIKIVLGYLKAKKLGDQHETKA